MPQHLVGSCTTEQEALSLYESEAPTLIITTQVLEEGSGISLAARIKEIDPHMPTLLFLQYRNMPLYREAIGTHSDGIVLEPSIGAGHIVKALETVCKGGMYLEPIIGQAVAGSTEPGPERGLTQRELEVMRHVVIGLNDREIGETLHLATDTIKYHLKQVYAKLSVHNRTRAAISLVLMGLVPPPMPLIPE
jgi:DNA-binding NarL/FixJ family response regulator